MPDKIKQSKKFENFLHAFGAARLLLQKAHKNGSLIEGLVLYASLVDGFCRICLVLKEQLDEKDNNINEKYIYQYKDEKKFTERKIYKLAFDKEIIKKKMFEELNSLYNIRNKVIHRFFISEVEYSHLEIACSRYEKLYEQLYKITYELESEQINRGIGMTIKGRKFSEQDRIETEQGIARKIKSGSERNLARTLDCVSVEEVIEFGSKNGLFIKCVCDHEKIKHIDLKLLNGIGSSD